MFVKFFLKKLQNAAIYVFFLNSTLTYARRDLRFFISEFG